MQKSVIFFFKKEEDKRKKIENKYLKDKKYRQVRDHCHYKGEYRSAAHSIYNSK